MALFKANKRFLNRINKYEFGSYLEFVESTVFEIETVVSRANKLKRTLLNKKILSILSYLAMLMALSGCPTILLILAFGEPNSTFTEKLIYTAWALWGLFFHRTNTAKLINEIRTINDKLFDINTGLKWGVVYCSEVVDTFFNKGEFYKNVFVDLSEKDKSAMIRGLEEIEFDLTTQEEIATRNNHCNVKPVLLDENYYQKGREFSRRYLSKYFKYRLNYCE